MGLHYKEVICAADLNIAKLAVFGDIVNPENRMQVVSLDTVLNAALECENRWILQVHHGESAHHTIVQAVIDFGLLTIVVDLLYSAGHRF